MMTDKKVKCTDCGELMNDIDEFGCCFSCDLIARFSDHLHSALGIEEGDLIGKHAELATELVEMARDRILKRVVFQQRPSAEFIEDVYTGMVLPEDLNDDGEVSRQPRN